jgi:hypothetical protein
MQKFRNASALPIAALWWLLVTACQSWNPSRVPLAANTAPPNEMRLTERNGTRIVLAHPRLENDSIHGFIGGKGAEVAIASSDVVWFEQKGVNGPRTAGAILLGAAGVVIVLAILALAAFSDAVCQLDSGANSCE